MSATGRYSEVVVGGLKTARLSRGQMAALMVEDCLAARKTDVTPKLVFSTNGNSIARAALDAQFREHHTAADLLHADGQPVVLASRLLTRSPIPGRSATTDFFHDAAVAASKHGLRFFLLGGTEAANEGSTRVLRKTYPGLQIVGRRHGYFSHEEESAVCAEINAANADVVWVGLGVPLEQAFCLRNKHRLRAGWLMTAGGCFNFVTGAYARAPRWMQNAGLEWLYRVWKEPRRLAWRYAVTNPVALFMLLTRTYSISSQSGRTSVAQTTILGSEPA